MVPSAACECSGMHIKPLCAIAIGHETLANALANVAVERGLVVGVLRCRVCVSYTVHSSCSAKATKCINRQVGSTHRIANSKGSCRKRSSCDGSEQLACGADMPARDTEFWMRLCRLLPGRPRSRQDWTASRARRTNICQLIRELNAPASHTQK